MRQLQTSTIGSIDLLNGPLVQRILQLKNLWTEGAYTGRSYQLSHECQMWNANGHILSGMPDVDQNLGPNIYSQHFLDVI